MSPTARGADRIYCSLSISPPSPHAGGDARAPRTHVVQSCCPSLSAVRTPEPRGGFHALREGFSPHAQRRARAGGLRPGEPRGSLTEVGFSRKLLWTSPVSGIRTPELPLLPLWEKGAGGMRGKSARNTEHRSSLPKTLHLRAGGMRGKSAPECRKPLISPKKSTLERRGYGL